MINIDELIKESLRSGNKAELKVYRNIKTKIQENQTAKGAKPLTEQLQCAIIAKYAASLEHAIYEFLEAHRDDLVSEYTSELEVVKKLLPKPVNESQIYSELCNWQINSAFEKNWPLELDRPIIPKKEMGNAIKYLKSKFPAADGKIISEIVKKYLV